MTATTTRPHSTAKMGTAAEVSCTAATAVAATAAASSAASVASVYRARKQDRQGSSSQDIEF
jgi:hypothetical protein